MKFEWGSKGTNTPEVRRPADRGEHVLSCQGHQDHPQGFPICYTSSASRNHRCEPACPKSSQLTTAGEAARRSSRSANPNECPRECRWKAFFAPTTGCSSSRLAHAGLVRIHFDIAQNYCRRAVRHEATSSNVPLVETVPGAPDGSAETINVTAGAAIKKNGKTIYYGTVPKKCPKGGFP